MGGEVQEITVKMQRYKETKNTVRYEWVSADEEPVYITTLYIHKIAMELLDEPDTITVRITAG